VHAQAEEELATASPARLALLDVKDPIGALRRMVQADDCAWVRDTNLTGISAVVAPVRDYTGRVCAVLTALGFNPGS
jgi:DNA-binding IclR family transcriptional regulator